MSQKAAATLIEVADLKQRHRIVGDRLTSQRAIDLRRFRQGDLILIDIASVDFGALGRFFVRSAQQLARLFRDGDIADANLTHAGVYLGDGRVVDLVPGKNVRIIEVGEFLGRATRAVIVRHRAVIVDKADLLKAAECWYSSIRYVSLAKLAGASVVRLFKQDYLFNTAGIGGVSAVSICSRFSLLLLTTAHQNAPSFDPHEALPIASANVHFVADLVRADYIRDNRLRRIDVTFLQVNRQEPPPIPASTV